MHSEAAEKEKKNAALLSIAAAVFLTLAKAVVGIESRSLGILAEAAHSLLDLAAAIVTFWAIHYASKPADREHQYGHGKIENVSALIETALLLLTCAWVIYEAVERLFFRPVAVRASLWSFAVVVVAILVDFFRARHLHSMAKKHRSQALEADALHFSTDVWSSCVVLLGLVNLKLAEIFPSLGFLAKADVVAGLVVALIVVWVALKLGRTSLEELLDSAPSGVADQIKATVETIPGVLDCHQIRVRHSGAQLFVDLHISVKGSQSLQQAHALSDEVERRVSEVWPGADTTVHPEPLEGAEADDDAQI